MNIITRPTLFLNEQVCRTNIQRMVRKTGNLNLDFRPHFKTHQSRAIGEWFREAGIDAITVSSVKMARYFAGSGWNRITIAFPFNVREFDEIATLSGKVELDLLISDPDAIPHLKKFRGMLNVWIEMDTGYHRSGLACEHFALVESTISSIEKHPNLHVKGFLSHTGNTYTSKKKEEVSSMYFDAVRKLVELRNRMKRSDSPLAISMGDTPSASLLDRFGPVQELRPGNFVFYDLMQYRIGVCQWSDIAVALACPVVAKYPGRNEIVVYGGAVHLSKERMEMDGHMVYGQPVWLDSKGWHPMEGDNWVTSLSQEHGILKMAPGNIGSIAVGDTIGIIPVHSCLTASTMKGYKTLHGTSLDHLEGIGTF